MLPISSFQNLISRVPPRSKDIESNINKTNATDIENMEYLGIKSSILTQIGGIHTATEIAQQPQIWEQVWEGINAEQPALQKFLTEAFSNSSRILITGAGTSAFIGLSLRGTFQRLTGLHTEVVPSTDIVSHPKDYFQASIPTLMISFARSGNSPESVAAVALADEFSTTCYHLIITCNEEGKLANYRSPSTKFIKPAQSGK